VTVVNAFIVYKEQTNDMKTNPMKFRLSLVAGLIGAKTNTPTRAKTSPNLPNKFKPYVAPGLRYDKTSHLPLPVGVPNAALKRNPIVQNGFVKHVKLDCA
jgi:hypothetical protein